MPKTFIPALQEVGGSLCKSLSSFTILFDAMNCKAQYKQFFNFQMENNVQIQSRWGMEEYIMIKLQEREIEVH